MSSLAIGAAGLHAATQRFETSAARIARFGTGPEPVDLATEMVTIIEAKADFKAAAKIVGVARDMDRALLDIFA